MCSLKTKIQKRTLYTQYTTSFLEKSIILEREVDITMRDLQIFNNEEFGQVRTVMINNEPWFVGKDVADILGYQNGSRDVNRHVDAEDRADVVFHDGSQRRNMIGVNESGLYALIFGSKMETAKKFKHWVTSEVLPTLRQTGTYTVNTTCQYPVSAAAIEGATNAGRLFERIMKSEGIPPHEIAMAVRSIFLQAGVDIPEFVVKIPAYEQYSLTYAESGV